MFVFHYIRTMYLIYAYFHLLVHIHCGYYGCAPSYIKVVPPKKQKKLYIFVFHYIRLMSIISTYFDLLVHVHYG